jgi:hypothetical protein
MEPCRNAVAAALERSAIMSTEVTVTDNRSAPRDVSRAMIGHSAARKAPGMEAPADVSPRAQSDSDTKPDSGANHHTHRHRRDHEARVRDHQRTKYDPGVVIRDRDDQRIHWRDHDCARRLDHYPLLRRRDQHVSPVRFEPERLDRIHHVVGLIVVSVAKLRRPRRVRCQIGQHVRKSRESLHRRVPGHGVNRGDSPLHRNRQVLNLPGLGGRHLVRVRRSRQYLRNQRIRIERKRRD